MQETNKKTIIDILWLSNNIKLMYLFCALLTLGNVNCTSNTHKDETNSITVKYFYDERTGSLDIDAFYPREGQDTSVRLMNIGITKGRINWLVLRDKNPNYRLGLEPQVHVKAGNTLGTLAMSFPGDSTMFNSWRWFPNGQLEQHYNLQKGSVEEYDTSGISVERSRLKNGSGYMVQYNASSDKYDTVFMVNGQVLRRVYAEQP